MYATTTSSRWVDAAIALLIDDARVAPPTPLRRVPLMDRWGIDILLKDESVHPTGSLKHRLARSLFLHAIVDGHVNEGMTIVEASSGSTAVSEAYFAQRLGLPFIAVVPRETSPAKLDLIRSFGGLIHEVDDATAIAAHSECVARERDGHFMDQFANAARVTEWTGESSIAAELFGQLRAMEREAQWVVVGAGTGGTSAAFGRYRRSRRLRTRIALADPEGSAYFHRLAGSLAPTAASRIEGIGRAQVEASFLPGVVDQGIRVLDAQSVAAMRLLAARTGIEAGPSTGTNLVATLFLACRMRDAGEEGTIVSLICDGADRYGDTYYEPEWVRARGLDPAGSFEELIDVLESGRWAAPEPAVAAGGGI